MTFKKRIEKLSQEIEPQQPIFVLIGDQQLTEAQQLEAARAEAAGIKPHIIHIVKASEMMPHSSHQG